MNQLSPKREFQVLEEIKKELATVVASDNFKLCLTYALAEFSWQLTPSADQLSAVRAFMLVLINLPFPDTPAPVIPIKTLDRTITK